MEPFNVLLSSAGRRVALLEIWRRTLSDLGRPGRILAADITPLSSAFHSADAGFTVPRCTTSEFVPAMLQLCRREHVRLVVPTIDTELPIYAAHRQAFADLGTTVAVSSPETIAIATDKRDTHAWLVAKGFPAPRQASVEQVLADPKAWLWPLIAKPALGSSSVGVAKVATPAELEPYVRRADYIVQSIAGGVEHTVDVWIDRHGRPGCAVPRRRLEVRAGEVSKGITVRVPALQDLALRVSEALPGAFGVINIQVFVDATSGEMNIIEINPRFGGGFPLASQAGARYAQWMLEDLLELPSTARADAWQAGLVMLRYDAAVFVDGAKVGL